MKTKIITIMSAAVILCFTGSEIYAVPIDKIFTSDGVIIEGDEYANVYIYDTPPDRTTVNMSGGSAYNILTYDYSRLNVNGGTSEVYARNESTVNIGDGVVYTLDSYDFSMVNIFGGQTYHVTAYNTGTVNVLDNATLGTLFAHNFGVVNMSGGKTSRIGAAEFSTVNLSGGLVTDDLAAGDSGIINVYGYDLNKESIGGKYYYGFVSVYWKDSTPFNISLNSPDTYSRVMLIPEPSTLLLFLISVPFLRRFIR